MLVLSNGNAMIAMLLQSIIAPEGLKIARKLNLHRNLKISLKEEGLGEIKTKVWTLVHEHELSVF